MNLKESLRLFFKPIFLIILILVCFGFKASIVNTLILNTASNKINNFEGSTDENNKMVIFPFEYSTNTQKIQFKFLLEKHQKVIYSDYIQVKFPITFTKLVDKIVFNNVMNSILKAYIINEKYQNYEKELEVKIFNYSKEDGYLLINFMIIEKYNSLEVNSVHNVIEMYLQLPFAVETKSTFYIQISFMSSYNHEGIIYFTKIFKNQNKSFNYSNSLSILDAKFYNFEKLKGLSEKIYVNIYHDLKIEFAANSNINKGNFLVLKIINFENTSYSLSNLVYSKDFYNNKGGVIDEMGNFKLTVLIPKTIKISDTDSDFTFNDYIFIEVLNDILPGNYSFIVKKCYTGKQIGTFSFELNLIDETYSIISFSSLNKKFKIEEGEILINSINHPENSDIYQGSIWPIVFDLTLNVSNQKQ